MHRKCRQWETKFFWSRIPWTSLKPQVRLAKSRSLLRRMLLCTYTRCSERMIEYIQNRRQWECVATLRYPNVVQKSYGQEKRYQAFSNELLPRRICPPPCIRLRGDGWIEKKRQTAEMYEHCEERRKFSKSSLQGCEVCLYSLSMSI